MRVMFPEKELFVYTRHRDRGLSIHVPTEDMIASMNRGVRHGITRTEFDEDVFRQVHDGVAEDAARIYLKALCLGGADRAAAVKMIRDRNIPRRGFNIVPITRADVPDDRTFRDAWRFSHNERVFYVDLEAARPIQFRRFVGAVQDENKRRSEDLYGKPELPLDRDSLRFNILNARDEVELARIMPELH